MASTKQNVYEKLQLARVDLQQKAIAKSGKNSHAGYSYHELADFMPHVNQILCDHKLCSVVSFTSELATLTLFNAENPEEQVVFTSPMAEASLRGVQPIQNVGAVQTYQRRYLYMTALEIVEHDALDASKPERPESGTQSAQKPTSAPASNDGGATPDERQECLAKVFGVLCNDPYGMTQEEVKRFVYHRMDVDSLKKAPMDKVAGLAKACVAIAKGNEVAKKTLDKALAEWRKADMYTPDDVPTGDEHEEQPALQGVTF